jgi:hypothetical protein
MRGEDLTGVLSPSSDPPARGVVPLLDERRPAGEWSTPRVRPGAPRLAGSPRLRGELHAGRTRIRDTPHRTARLAHHDSERRPGRDDGTRARHTSRRGEDTLCIDGRHAGVHRGQPSSSPQRPRSLGDGTVNLSPKGLRGSLVVLDDLTLAIPGLRRQQRGDSGAPARERADHLMWCAFQGPPNIVRVHGTRRAGLPRRLPLARAAEPFRVQFGGGQPRPTSEHRGGAEVVRDTCGFAVPLMTYVRGPRPAPRALRSRGRRLAQRHFGKKAHIASSIDGLRGIPLPLPPTPPRLHQQQG